jgi:hypothetical protein
VVHPWWRCEYPAINQRSAVTRRLVQRVVCRIEGRVLDDSAYDDWLVLVVPKGAPTLWGRRRRVL